MRVLNNSELAGIYAAGFIVVLLAGLFASYYRGTRIVHFFVVLCWFWGIGAGMYFWITYDTTRQRVDLVSTHCDLVNVTVTVNESNGKFKMATVVVVYIDDPYEYTKNGSCDKYDLRCVQDWYDKYTESYVKRCFYSHDKWERNQLKVKFEQPHYNKVAIVFEVVCLILFMVTVGCVGCYGTSRHIVPRCDA